MKYCSNCGHELGVGRYCTNCGRPVDSPADPDWRTDTAERAPLPPPPAAPPPPPAAPPPATPPPAAPPPATPPPATPPPTAPPPRTPPPAPAGAAEPGSPRFPLFADEVEGTTATSTYPAVAVDQPEPEPTAHRRSRPWPVWLLVAAVLIVVAAVGVRLLTGDDPDQAADTSGDSTHTPGKKHGGKGASPAPPTPGDVTADATVEVPATAPAGKDTEGRTVDYDATNMLDGVPETTWRMAGDGTGKELTITLPGETKLRSVGLINGYAKTVPGAKGGQVDWYHGNRRIQQVEWVFDDGTTASQSLGDTTGLQSVDVDATTTTIVLRLIKVTPPGTGPSARNYTAISDLSLISAD